MLRHLITARPSHTLQRQFQRSYHSEKGVFGYRPLPKRDFLVSEEVLQSRNAQGNVYRWVEAFRKHGHKLASLNPINIAKNKSSVPELAPEFYGLQPNMSVSPQGLLNLPQMAAQTTVADFQELLKQLYCGSAVSAEFAYIESLEEREWLAQHYEQLGGQTVNDEARRQIAELLIKAQAWDNFVAVKYPSVKRYSGEGGESLLAFFWQLMEDGAQENIEHIVVAMSHRGRTELQTALLNMRPAKIFSKLNGKSEFADGIEAMADVVAHFHTSEDFNINGKKIHVSLIRNPSHLEAGNPVAMGKTRSKQQASKDGAFSDDGSKRFGTTALNVLMHGDAAFAGQGVNQECLNMAYVPHFDIGGTVHLIINNQVGFTTPAERGRSTDYATDLAKTIQAPVFHVNGDDPEMVALVTRMALQYQRQFRKDVFIDLNCFRQWGHNELDDPTFTNPSVYKIIHSRKTVPDLYAARLAENGVLPAEKAESIRNTFMDYLNAELALAATYEPEPSYFERQWSGIKSATNDITIWDTGLDYSLLSYIGHQSVDCPADFATHPHLQRTHIEARKKKLLAGSKIDWSTAEALAFGSLMYQGFNVRISGEDVGRGTFSHRHVMLVDQETNEMYIPLNDLKGGHGGMLEVANSILSEEAVLAYEYGMAIDNPNNLIVWEAQFGDFANGAQIGIDNFIASAETKWMDSNALVMLLPHGFDGGASEHSSSRIERFLQLSDSSETSPDGDNVNLHVVNPTTAAQYFHVLRRQMLRNFRKPLVVISPKTLLRLSAAASSYADFQPGTHFRNVIGDTTATPDEVQKVIICSGKHYYNLDDERCAKSLTNTAIVRLESLSPFPMKELQDELAKYPRAQTFIWSQEEHRNMGAWSFVSPRFERLTGQKLKYAGRAVGATSATGIGNVHKLESEEVITAPFQM